MYTEQELETLRQQKDKRVRLLAAAGAVLAVLIIVSVYFRVQAVTVGLTVLLGSMLVFVIEMLIRPVTAYIRYVDHMLHGRTHETVLCFDSLSENVDLVEGVRCRALTVIDPADEKAMKIRYYLDAMKELPESIRSGQPVRIVYHDRFVAEIALAEKN